MKYGNPILVSTSIAGKKNQKKKQQALAPLEKPGGTTRNEDYLNSILPPREYTEMGQLYVSYVSPQPASKVDVLNLVDELERRWHQKNVRETGICPWREELFSQCFDELIRQITIECAERGFLLVRTRDEIKMTIQAYTALYESSIAYGMRKALIAEQRKIQMQTEIKNLEDTIERLQKECKSLEQTALDMIVRDEEERLAEQKEHRDKINYMNELNEDYKADLVKQLSAPTNQQR